MPNASHTHHDVSSCGQKPLIEIKSFMLSAVICNRVFLTVRKSVAQDRCGSLLPLSGSHASLTLRRSATLRGRAPTGRTHRTPTRRLPMSERARSRAAQTPGGIKLADREGKASVWGGARHACCSAVGRTRGLDARRDHMGPGHWVRKETSYATERRHDAWGGSHRA